MSETLQLVSMKKATEINFPDPGSRPSDRSVADWKAKGYFRFRKIGGRVFVDPQEMRHDLDRQFTKGGAE